MIGYFNLELMNYSGTELINYSGIESINSLDSELINHSGRAPGKRCPTCKAAGREVWVFAGRSCPVCLTYVP
jgi:hypothetical protein